MDLESIKTWIMANKMLAAGIGIFAIGGIAYLLTSSQNNNHALSGLSGIGRNNNYRKRKRRKSVKLLGLT